MDVTPETVTGFSALLMVLKYAFIFVVVLAMFLVKGTKILPAFLGALKVVATNKAEAQMINTVLMQSIDTAREVIGNDKVSELTKIIAERAERAGVLETLDKTLAVVRKVDTIGISPDQVKPNNE